MNDPIEQKGFQSNSPVPQMVYVSKTGEKEVGFATNTDIEANKDGEILIIDTDPGFHYEDNIVDLKNNREILDNTNISIVRTNKNVQDISILIGTEDKIH